MTSILRSLLASLLCGMIAIGHAPAWLHVAVCDRDAHLSLLVTDASAADSDACPHGCHEHPVQSGAGHDDNPSGAQDLPPTGGHDHDSDACPICQSLVAPTGVDWQSPSLLIGDASVGDAERAELSAPAPAFLTIAQPRGPPAPLA